MLGRLEVNKRKLALMLYIFVNLVFVISDWKIKIVEQSVSLSDILILFSMLPIFITLIFTYKHKGMNPFIKKIVSPIILMVFLGLIHLLIQRMFNYDFIFTKGLISLAKLVLYSTLISFTYNVYNYDEYNRIFFVVVEKTAILVSLIGVYITLLIYLKRYVDINNKYYEIFWTFTRKDLNSYTLRQANIIRFRSVFSEPSYYGTYLNIILSIFYFGKDNKFTYKYTRPILIFSIFMTFALSVWGVYIVVETLRLYRSVQAAKTSDAKPKYFRYIWVSIIIALILFVFKDAINNAFINRIKLILSGGDGSASARLFESWGYIYHPIIGNGIGQTPPIWNYFAYVISDFGIFAFFAYFIVFIKALWPNKYILIVYTAIHFSRGGYLSAFNFMTILFLMILMYGKDQKRDINLPQHKEYIL